MKRQWYGVILGALGLLVLLRLAGDSSMLRLVGVLLVLAALAVAFLRHEDDDPAPGTDPAADAVAADPDATRPADPTAESVDPAAEGPLPAAD